MAADLVPVEVDLSQHKDFYITHVHVVYPVSTDGSSVVAEVVLDGRNSHLQEQKR